MTTTVLRPPDELLEALHSSRRPLLIAHLSPDGDALGSLLALGIILYRLGKEPILACQDKPHPGLQFLPYADRVKTNVDQEEPDLVVALDSSDEDRLGSVYDPRRFGSLRLVVIDHHITNGHFGQVNWVEPTACATAEMVYELAGVLQAPIDASLATCLLTGIITDTRGFRTPSTNARTFAIASSLIAAGAPLTEITDQTLDTRSLELVRLWTRVLATLELEQGVASAVNTVAMRADLGGIIRVDSLASFLLGIPEAHIAAVFTELPEGNKVECSFRASPGYDVAIVAYEFGGGGHPLAAGCTVEGSLAQVVELVRKRLMQAAGGR